ncbi:MAG TPA: hypothetical protein VFB72_12430 [Verrucomicrobiae bacterium]|nr:hypothetical protein [Verrucomicrobiae bacterium]
MSEDRTLKRGHRTDSGRDGPLGRARIPHAGQRDVPTFRVVLSVPFVPFTILFLLFMVPVYHANFRKMKRTVGLTAFFSLMNLCEKKRVLRNIYAGLMRFKKVVFLRGVKKTIFPT